MKVIIVGAHGEAKELINRISSGWSISVIDLDQDSLNSIRNEGRKNVKKKFDVEAMCDSTLREYKKLLDI